ncbi:serine/threonine-protein phosphatase 6 regulatory ankyrin repeat subunit B-like [Sycon ciliatum]|uniref:serine/threonine-protein phosphatase 6 regulatory ankyrin repeat subunit B-like n=1 Tax=Sycon ciliatum TaxID=27933 RepID=UPI0031F5F7FB
MSSEQVELFAEAVRQPGATMEDLQDAVPPEQPQLSSTSRKVRWESPFMTSYWGRKHCYSMGTMLLFVICSEGLHLGEDFLSTIVHYIFSVHSVEVNEEEATEDNWTLLHYCAAYGNDRLASILIGKGADVNAPGRRGMLWTPLHLAVNGARINVIKVMLSHDRDGVTLDTTLQDSGARTALDIAREYNQKGCVQLLVDHESAKVSKEF